MKPERVAIAAVAILAMAALVPVFVSAPVAHAALDYTDCPSGTAAATSAASGNPGTGFVVLSTGNGPGAVQYSVTIPANSDLIEYCVYPNGGAIGTVTSPSAGCTILASGKTATSTLVSACSTPVANWSAGFNCGSYSCVEARANKGTDHLLGPQGPTKILYVTYTSALSSDPLIVLHVSDEGSGVCGQSGTATAPTTCFIIPTPPTTSTTTTGGCPPGGCPPPVPEFPLGFLPLLLVVLPLLYLVKKGLAGAPQIRGLVARMRS